MTVGLITVLGGTGFLGRFLVDEFRHAGYRTRVAVRHPQPGTFSTVGTDVEQVECDICDPAAVARAVDGADGVVNAVGLYLENVGNTFHAVHVKGARSVAGCVAEAGARLVHISGIGCDLDSPSRYVRARAAGEQGVREADPGAVILRPSVLFGPGDAFLSSLVSLIRVVPVVPLFGNGATRLQPVYAKEVATAAVIAVTDANTAGNIYELGGAGIYSYRELLTILAAHVRRRRLLLPIPFLLWDMLAAVASLMPNPSLTRDQIVLMRNDNVVSVDARTFRELGITPSALEQLLSFCLNHP